MSQHRSCLDTKSFQITALVWGLRAAILHSPGSIYGACCELPWLRFFCVLGRHCNTGGYALCTSTSCSWVSTGVWCFVQAHKWNQCNFFCPDRVTEFLDFQFRRLSLALTLWICVSWFCGVSLLMSVVGKGHWPQFYYFLKLYNLKPLRNKNMRMFLK